jgi:hypothetical protein
MGRWISAADQTTRVHWFLVFVVYFRFSFPRKNMVYDVILCHADIRLQVQRATPAGRRWAGRCCMHARVRGQGSPWTWRSSEVLAPVVWVMALGRRRARFTTVASGTYSIETRRWQDNASLFLPSRGAFRWSADDRIWNGGVLDLLWKYFYII